MPTAPQTRPGAEIAVVAAADHGVEVGADRPGVEQLVLAVVDPAVGQRALAAQPQPVLVGAEPALAAPAEAVGVAEPAFELVQHQVVEDVAVHHRRTERRGIAGIGRRTTVLRLGGGAIGDAEHEKAGQCPREERRAHDTSTVRNMPISM